MRRILLLSLLVTLAHGARAIDIGTSQADVVAQLGRPDGLIETEKFTWLYYTRGIVKLEDGHVVEADLLSPRQLAEQQIRDHAEWDRNQQIVRAREQRRQEQERRLLQQQRDQREREERARLLEQELRIRELEARVREAEDRERRDRYSYRSNHNVQYFTPVVYAAPSYVVRPVHVSPVGYNMSGGRSRVVTSASYLDRAFGPMHGYSSYTPGYHAPRRSGVSGRIQVAF